MAHSDVIDTTLPIPPEPAGHRRWLPFGERSRPRRLAKVLGWLAVQKIFFSLAGTFVYAYLLLSAPGSIDLQVPALQDHPVLTLAVFLAGYGITVTFHTVMSVVGGGSIANAVSVTPGVVGVNQAADVAALNDVTDAATATAYSLGQQLAITAWNVAFALVLVIWAFGWTGGKLLVEQSYTDAAVKVEEQKTRRAEAKTTRRAARPPERTRNFIRRAIRRSSAPR